MDTFFATANNFSILINYSQTFRYPFRLLLSHISECDHFYFQYSNEEKDNQTFCLLLIHPNSSHLRCTQNVKNVQILFVNNYLAAHV